MPPFIPGLELCRRFYHAAVRPVLDARFPGLLHAAARIGTGSEVLGFDTAMSMDHDWGPHVRIFLREEDAGLIDAIRATMREDLPPDFEGFPSYRPQAQDDASPDPRHYPVWPTTCRRFFWGHLRYAIDQPLDAADWLTIPSQMLLQATAGAVYHDEPGELTEIRARLAYYPRDVWLYMLAAGWQRIGQEEHLMPRAGFVGDELGSSIMGSRLVRDIMSLCFLMERRYAPYPKWFGTAFQRLACAPELSPVLWRAQQAATWQQREEAFVEAYAAIARMHNALGLTQPLPEEVSAFYGRPFRVIQGEQFAAALREQISGDEMRRIAERRLIGSVDQWSDSTDIRSEIEWRPLLRALYTQ